MKRILCAVSLCVFTCACYVPNRSYRVGKSIVQVPKDPTAPGPPQPDCVPEKRPCLAFVEFDEKGEAWDMGQTDKALDLIDRTAKRNPRLTVIAFVHGWKNNAGETPGNNVSAFQQALNGLAETYCPGADNCNHPIVGVYLSWRGDLVPKYWPLRRQLSYFNRETTARDVSGPAMTDTLSQMILRMRRVASEHGTLVLVGHSFGGLILERALSQVMTGYIAEVDEAEKQRSEPRNANEALRIKPQPPADLIAFVNSAAAASEAKQMLDLLKKKGASFGHDGLSRPLFVSLSSLGDAATRFGLPIGHGVPYLAANMRGSWRADDRPYGYSKPVSQASFFLSTAAHMELLQSQAITTLDNCAARLPGTSAMLVRSKPDEYIVQDEHGLPKKAPDGVALDAGEFARIRLPEGGLCFSVGEKEGRWNDTPYWLMQMPASIVPDHSTIFTTNFMRLLAAFIPPPTELQPERSSMSMSAK